QSFRADGTGQAIALVEAYHDPNIFNDLHTFDRTYGLPDPAMTQYRYGNQSDDGWAGEETLDVEWAHALAPAARIIVVEARTSGFADLNTAVSFARSQPGVSVVSMSYGGGEFAGETSYDSLYTTPSGHNGITFIASTGDH